MELGPNSGDMVLKNLEAMSVEMNMRLLSNPEQQNIKISLVQGSGFVSAVYSNLRPKFTSAVLFRSVSQVQCPNAFFKWRIQLEDGNVWLLYAVPFSENTKPLKLHLRGNSSLEGSTPFNGLVQVTKVPCKEQEFGAVADACAGAWATSTHVSAYYDVTHPSAIGYTFDFTVDHRACTSNLLMYALPHHIDSFGKEMHKCIYSKFNLQSTTKGLMTAVISSRWHLREDHIVQDTSCDIKISSETSFISKIGSSAREEAQGDPAAESNLDSMYFAGKALDKYACLCWVICAVLKDVELSQQLLVKLKMAFARFAENRQRFPLTYESEVH